MRIPPEKIDEINNANDIVDVISTYVQVKRRGRNFLALCPFHPDKNPSMNISQEKKVYHCFSCGASGNMFRFVQDIEKISFFEAAQKLASRAGIDIKYNKKEIANYDEYVKLYDINTRAARYFVDSLKNVGGNESKVVHDYIKKRNLKPGTLTRFGIGYAYNRWDGLLNFFREDDLFSNEELEAAGLIKKREMSDENTAPSYYDRFRGRLIFPIFNEAGKVVAFGGRQLFEDDKTAKYLNSPETKVYSKSKILYGLNFAKDSINANDFVLFVEGYMDVVSLFQAGFENVVATSGTALSQEQVTLISRYTNNIIFLFDADSAGVKAAKRGLELILEADLNLDIVTLPQGEDPDSFISKFGLQNFKELISQKKSFINFIADIYEKDNRLSTIAGKVEFIKEIISYIGKIPDSIKRSLYIKEIASLYKLSEVELLDELRKFIKNAPKKTYTKSSVVIPELKELKKEVQREKGFQTQLSLIEHFVQSGEPEVIDYIEGNLMIGSIKNRKILEVVSFFLEEYINEGKISPSLAINLLEDRQLHWIISHSVFSKYRISPYSGADRNSYIAKNSEIKVSYRKSVVDVVFLLNGQLEIDNIHEKILLKKEMLRKIGDNEKQNKILLEIRDLKKEKESIILKRKVGAKLH